VTASLFPTLGVQPALGRTFREDEDHFGTAKTAILSDGLWRRLFAAEPGAVGRTLMLNDEPYTIVGVMPARFRFPSSDTEIWAPVGTRNQANYFSDRGRHNLMVVARLAAGVTVERANQEIGAICRSLAERYPETNRNVGAFVAPMRDHFVGESRSLLVVLLGAVGFVLLIACVNIANLLLARAVNRRHEIAIRAAMGAGRRQLVRQLLTEAVVLACAGGACGLALAHWSLRFLDQFVPRGISGMTALELDARVAGFTLAVSLATGVAFGLLPAFQAVRVDLYEALKQGGGRRVAGGTGLRMQQTLVIAEVALAFVLTVGAGLMIRTLVRLRGVDPGFRTRNILTVRASMPARLYQDDAKRAAFLDEVLSRVEALPGVVSAGFSNGVPIAFKGWVNGFTIEDHPVLGAGQFSNSNFRLVTPDYFATLGIPLRRGRPLEARDRPGAPYVTLVNEAFERKFWPGGSALGKRLRFGSGQPWVTIVGVVGDIRQSGLDVPPRAEMYLPAAQVPDPTGWLAVRTAGDPSKLAAAVRRELRAADRDLPITGISTMEEILDRETSDRRVQMLLLAVFAGVAVLLAAVGIYGVLAYMVAQRTHEIGIRMALGAQASDVLLAVAGQGVMLSAFGILVGAAGAWAVTRVLSRLLFGVAATDPATFGSVGALLLVVAAAAAYLPARRATKVDPIRACGAGS
jgi:putative ABC transport system permease protein